MSLGRILIVDDHPQIRRVLRTTLIAQAYEVKDARNGEEALDLCSVRENWNLIILDMNMPGMTGNRSLPRSIRSTSDVAIIMLTVRDNEADKVSALDAGADDYVTKPFSSPELLARVRAALRRSPQTAVTGPQSIRFEDVEINFSTRRAIVNSREIRLTPKRTGPAAISDCAPERAPYTPYQAAPGGLGPGLRR